MKIFFTALFIILSLQSYSRADNIKEIELDGNSLLNFTSENEIKKNKLNYFEDERQYYVVFYDKNLSRFDDMEIYLKTNDKI
jgi:hypothetical protein